MRDIIGRGLGISTFLVILGSSGNTGVLEISTHLLLAACEFGVSIHSLLESRPVVHYHSAIGRFGAAWHG